MAEAKPSVITICMGSSCYSRGNGRNLEVIRQFLALREVEATVEVIGHLCEDRCQGGPNLAIDGSVHQQQSPSTTLDLLSKAFGS